MLIGSAWLAAHLYDTNVLAIEVDVSASAYDRGHIDGALLWNIYADLKDEHYRPVGDHAIARLLARSGIRPDSIVVLYGYAPALGYWLLRLYGHADVRILNCSREAWLAEGHPFSASPSRVGDPADVGSSPVSQGLVERDPRLFVDATAVTQAIGRPGTTILDVRTENEYSGARFWPSGGMEPGGRAGHIPTAVNRPVGDLHDSRGAFRTPDELRGVVLPPDLPEGDELIVHCTVGARAATIWYVLTELLGRDRVRVYDGSWAEWGLLPDVPIAIGQPDTRP